MTKPLDLHKYGVQAINQSEMVMSAIFANLHSALWSEFSEDRREATFIFLACSRMLLSWAETALRMNQYE